MHVKIYIFTARFTMKETLWSTLNLRSFRSTLILLGNYGQSSHSKKSCTQQCIDVHIRLGWWLIKKSELNLLHWQIEHLTSQLVALRLSISIISMDWSFIVECQCVIKHAQMVNTIDSSVNSWLFAAGLYYEVGLKAHQFNETLA